RVGGDETTGRKWFAGQVSCGANGGARPHRNAWRPEAFVGEIRFGRGRDLHSSERGGGGFGRKTHETSEGSGIANKSSHTLLNRKRLNRIKASKMFSPRSHMNRTRLQIPLTPPEPHFDDESTIVSARRVVPIGRAPFSQRWRNVRAFVALLLLATVCSALASAV